MTIEREWLTVTETREKMTEVYGQAYSTATLTLLARNGNVTADKMSNGDWIVYWPSLIRYLEERGQGPHSE